MDLMQTYFKLLETANKKELSKFCFEFEGKIYLVKWDKACWKLPEELIQLSLI